VNLLTLLSDLVWEWKLFTWPVMISMLALLWFSRRDSFSLIVELAPYVRYGLMLLAAVSLAMFLASFFSTGKGQDRLAYVPVGLSLIPLWLAGLIATVLVPRAT
jgi:hypothetical protein